LSFTPAEADESGAILTFAPGKANPGGRNAVPAMTAYG
jgi:hypothetical protein